MKRVILKIYGEVQGIFYRAQTLDIARKLGLVGWVRNESDSTVQIIAEGEEKELKYFVEKCYTIPSAVVERIEVEWGEATGEFEEFKIRHH